LKYIISQNVDGLHLKSGIPIWKIAELHGNTNYEVCQSCGTGYMRDFRVRNKNVDSDHVTGRQCDNQECGGNLHDTTVYFGESLNKKLLVKSVLESEKADLCLCLGSSLVVTPARNFPRTTKRKGGKLVIVNL